MADGFGKVQILGEPWYKLNTAIHAAWFQIRKSLRSFTLLLPISKTKLKT